MSKINGNRPHLSKPIPSKRLSGGNADTPRKGCLRVLGCGLFLLAFVGLSFMAAGSVVFLAAVLRT